MYRLEAIKQLLLISKHQFAKLIIEKGFLNSLELQVNVIPGIERIEGEFKGRRWNAYKYPDGEIAKPFRIPWKANTETAEYTDSQIHHKLDKIEAIGSTGWNWKDKLSLWFGYDFDSITGHKSGLTEEELQDVYQKISKLDFINVITSKSGNGFHIYLLLDKPYPTISHTEHAALGRALLSVISSNIGYDLKAKVDVCGGNLWIYHQKVTDTGFNQLIKGKDFDTSLIPINWKDQVSVIEGKTQRVKFTDNIDEITGSTNTPLEDSHKHLLTWLQSNKCFSWWDHDRHMLVAHTADLKRAKHELKLIGLFDTNSEGKSVNDQNCFAFPLPSGGWIVRRHTKGVKEHPIWQDLNGWTTTTFNIPPDLATVSRINNGNLDEKGLYVFGKYQDALNALKLLGINEEIPPLFSTVLTTARLIKLRNGGLMLSIDNSNPHLNPLPDGYINERKKLKKIFNIKLPDDDKLFSNTDRMVRHIISKNKDAGWSINVNNKGWVEEPKDNIISFLSSKGIKDTSLILGKCVDNPWELVSLPFQPEYPGNRQWNKNAAQLAAIPEPGNYDTWNLVYNHCGKHLNEAVRNNDWCKENGITTGGEYLKCWTASIFQEPLEPLPYLFFYSPEENTGKSIFHEANSLLLKNNIGYVNVVNTLTNSQGFSGELLGAVICYAEEINLREAKTARERIKTYVTARYISIRPLYVTPFDIANTTHWIQCANNIDFCPIFPGDSRIVVIYVSKPENQIPKNQLLDKLKQEIPAFLYYLMELEIPKSNERLRIPVIVTEDKREQEKENRDKLSLFIEEYCHNIIGVATPFNKVLQAFHEYLTPSESKFWSVQKVGRLFPKKFPKGRYPGTNTTYIGNLSLDKFNGKGEEIKSDGIPWIQVDDRIYKENDPKGINK